MHVCFTSWEVRVRISRRFFKGVCVHAWLDRHSRVREELTSKGGGQQAGGGVLRHSPQQAHPGIRLGIQA